MTKIEVDKDFLIKVAQRQNELQDSIDILSDKTFAMNDLLMKQADVVSELIQKDIAQREEVIEYNGRTYIAVN